MCGGQGRVWDDDVIPAAERPGWLAPAPAWTWRSGRSGQVTSGQVSPGRSGQVMTDQDMSGQDISGQDRVMVRVRTCQVTSG